MKHTTEELLFAAAVRHRASELRSEKAKGMTDEEKDEYFNRPANDLIEEALKEFSGIASVIAKLRESEAAKALQP